MPLMNNILQDTKFASADIPLRQTRQAINKPMAASKDLNASHVRVPQARQGGFHAGQFLSLIQVQVPTAMHDTDDSKVKVDLKP